MRHVLTLAAILTLAAAPALAQDSVQHASAAINDSGAATAHLAASGVQTVGGVSAIPLGVAGGLSEVTGIIARSGGNSLVTSGQDAQKGAGELLEQTCGPLKVDNRVIVRPDPAPAVPYAPRK